MTRTQLRKELLRFWTILADTPADILTAEEREEIEKIAEQIDELQIKLRYPIDTPPWKEKT